MICGHMTGQGMFWPVILATNLTIVTLIGGKVNGIKVILSAPQVPEDLPTQFAGHAALWVTRGELIGEFSNGLHGLHGLDSNGLSRQKAWNGKQESLFQVVAPGSHAFIIWYLLTCLTCFVLQIFGDGCKREKRIASMWSFITERYCLSFPQKHS